ncbi:APC family permease [Candidatus Bathyarchaeota archaeon]|nr:APC family permease [Candidatus Bathyarchaeota archaeon]
MEKEVFVRKASGLIRNISALDAMVFNLMVMAPTAVLVYGIWASEIWPGVHLPTTALICIPLCIIVGLFYALYSAAMPRSGGDYVWISRTLHPVLGFMSTFWLFICILSVAGAYIPWFTQWALAPILEANGYAEAATVVSTDWFSFVFAVIWYLICALLISRGGKITSRVLEVFFGVIIVGLIVYVVTLVTGGSAQFATNFNAMSSMNYEATIQNAIETGFPGKFLMGATLVGFSFTLINFLGFHCSIYASGEIKEVHKSQFTAIIGAVIIFGLIDWIAYQASYVGMGGDFVGALSYLAATGHASYTLPFAEPFFVPFLYQYAVNSSVYTLVMCCWSAMILGAILTYVAIGVRLVFAWSFDRVLPTSLSKVDKRYGSPYTALIFVTIVAIILQAVWIWTPMLSYFAYIVMGWMIVQAICGISGLVFPRVKKDIYEKAPAIVRAKIGPVPWLSILAVLTILISIYLGYASMLPAMVGTIDPSILVFTFGVFAVGAVIYYISAIYHKKIGIPLDLTFKEIPPE